MGLFGTDEEREARRKQKERDKAALKEWNAQMDASIRNAGIQNKKDQFKAELRDADLDLEGFTDEELREAINRNIKHVNDRMFGTGVSELGEMLTIGHGTEALIARLIRTQISQNWILVRQNELIIRELKKLNSDKEESS